MIVYKIFCDFCGEEIHEMCNKMKNEDTHYHPHCEISMINFRPISEMIGDNSNKLIIKKFERQIGLSTFLKGFSKTLNKRLDNTKSFVFSAQRNPFMLENKFVGDKVIYVGSNFAGFSTTKIVNVLRGHKVDSVIIECNEDDVLKILNNEELQSSFGAVDARLFIFYQ